MFGEFARDKVNVLALKQMVIAHGATPALDIPGHETARILLVEGHDLTYSEK